jgi:hypothetical protein
MTALVERPDLSQRSALSKSVLTAFDLCETKVWNSIHDPRPFIPGEKVVFGSAVDAGVEIIVKSVASGQPVQLDRAFAAAAFVVERDGVELVFSDVERAIEDFERDVVPKFDWALTVTQASITAELEGLGECNGHPDIIFGSGAVYDVKTSGRAKDVPSLELGFYALLMEAHSGTPVPSVGYLNWVRLKRPYWQIAEAPVTDELRRWSYEKAAAYIRAKKADAALNANADTALNFSMGGGPKFDGLCSDCAYSPAFGGPCLIAVRGESDAA